MPIRAHGARWLKIGEGDALVMLCVVVVPHGHCTAWTVDKCHPGRKPQTGAGPKATAASIRHSCAPERFGSIDRDTLDQIYLWGPLAPAQSCQGQHCRWGICRKSRCRKAPRRRSKRIRAISTRRGRRTGREPDKEEAPPAVVELQVDRHRDEQQQVAHDVLQVLVDVDGRDPQPPGAVAAVAALERWGPSAAPSLQELERERLPRRGPGEPALEVLRDACCV